MAVKLSVVSEMEANRNHVLFVSRALPFHTMGGMEMIAWDLARQFVKDGLVVTFLTTAIPDKPSEFNVDGVNVIALKGMPSGRYSRAWWRKSKDYFEKHLTKQVSVIFSISAAAYGLMSAAKKQSIPVFLQAHGTSLGEIKSKWKTLSLKSILASLRNIYWLGKDLCYYPKFSEVVAIGDAVYHDLKQFPLSCVLPRNKVHLVCNGVDQQLFFPDAQQRKKLRELLGLTEDAKIIISVSRLHPQKGVSASLKAFAEYVKKNQNSYYLVAGDGPERLALEALAQQLQIKHKVLFVGAVQRDQLNQYLSVADVFLFTSKRSEGLPLNILEALAAGLPVILSKHLKNTIDVQQGIYAVDSSDVIAVANLIDQVLVARSSLLPERFTLQFCAREYYKLFKLSMMLEVQQ